jgi:hypothetical protein
MNDVTSAAAVAPAEALGATAAVTDGGGTVASGAVELAASTAGGESTTHESSQSLLSSAAGKTAADSAAAPDQPAPAAEPSTDAKPADPAVRDGASAEKKPEDPSKAETKADAETDPAAKDATAKEPPAQVSIEDLKLPDGAALDAESGKTFVDLINNGEISAKDRSQGLLDLHQKEIARVAKEIGDQQRKVWDDLNAGWKKELRNDPELGGNRLDTTLSMSKAVIEEFLSPEDAKAFLIHTDNNGMGNFPVFIRLLSNIGKRLNVFEDSIVAGGRAPAPAKGPGQRGWYDNTPSMK